MPRRRRDVRPGTIHHVLNRGNRRAAIFEDDEHYGAFLRILDAAGRRYPVSLFAFCLMPNHWHLVVRPNDQMALSAYMHWIGTTHVRTHHVHQGTVGGGHLYQERFRCFAVEREEHALMVLRYVEANARRAGLVRRAEDWPWGSYRRSLDGEAVPALAPWPIPRPADWQAFVNIATPESELASLRTSSRLGVPMGAPPRRRPGRPPLRKTKNGDSPQLFICSDPDSI